MDCTPEFTELLRTKSMMRYLPPKGTAGLERSCVSGCRRSPLPPASTTASTRLVGAIDAGLAAAIRVLPEVLLVGRLGSRGRGEERRSLGRRRRRGAPGGGDRRENGGSRWRGR